MQENTPTPKSDSIPTHDLDEYPEDTVSWALAWLEVLLNGEAYVGDPNNLKRLGAGQSQNSLGNGIEKEK